MYVNIAKVRGNGYSEPSETFSVDGKWLYDHAVKLGDRWQHPAVGCMAGFVVPARLPVVKNIGFQLFVSKIQTLTLHFLYVCVFSIARQHSNADARY